MSDGEVVLPLFDELDPDVTLTIVVFEPDPESGSTPYITGLGNVILPNSSYSLISVSHASTTITVRFSIGEAFARKLQYLGDDENIHTIIGPPVFANMPSSFRSPTLYQMLESGVREDSVSVEYSYAGGIWNGSGTGTASGRFNVQSNWQWANSRLRELAASGRN